MLDFSDRLDQLATGVLTRDRAHRGQRNNLSGQTAEAAVLRTYKARGATFIAERYRNAAGEIDVIVQQNGVYIIAEVKSAATFDAALARITPRQVARIYAAAEAFISTTPEGAFAEVRCDAALVDGQGQVQILEGALLPY